MKRMFVGFGLATLGGAAIATGNPLWLPLSGFSLVVLLWHHR